MIPGRTLHRIATRICSAKALEQIVEPTISDLQKEYCEAGHRSSPRRTWILLGGYLAILEVMLMCALQPSASMDDERRALIKMFAWTSGIIAAMGAVLVALVVAIVMIGGAPWPRMIHFAFLLPVAFPIVLPIAMTFGLAFGFGGRQASKTARRTIIATAFVASLLSLGTVALAVPLANQVFHQAAQNERGGRTSVNPPAQIIRNDQTRQVTARQVELRRQGAWNYHMRVALSFGTLALALFALALTGHRSKPERALVLTACAVYLLLVFASEALTFRGVPPAIAAWLANTVCLAATAYLRRVRSSGVGESLGLA